MRLYNCLEQVNQEVQLYLKNKYSIYKTNTVKLPTTNKDS